MKNPTQVEGDGSQSAAASQPQSQPILTAEALIAQFKALSAPNLEALRQCPGAELLVAEMDVRLKIAAEFAPLHQRVVDFVETDESLADTEAIPGVTWDDIESAFQAHCHLNSALLMMGILGGVLFLPHRGTPGAAESQSEQAPFPPQLERLRGLSAKGAEIADLIETLRELGGQTEEAHKDVISYLSDNASDHDDDSHLDEEIAGDLTYRTLLPILAASRVLYKSAAQLDALGGLMLHGQQAQQPVENAA